MTIERIKQLETHLAQLQRDVRKLQSIGGSSSRRNPRIALTVPDYLAIPQYPAAPTPEVRDPDTGELITPEGPHAKVFPFVFVDATFPNVAGITSSTYEARQNYSSVVSSRTYFAHCYNVVEKYIPQYTLIDVFEDGGKYWTNYNSSSGGGSPTPANVEVVPTLQTFYLGWGEDFSNVAYPTVYTRNPITLGSYPLSNFADMGLERVDGGQKWKSTRDNNGLIIHGAFWAKVELGVGSALGTGESVAIQLTLTHKNAAGGTVSTAALHFLDVTEWTQTVYCPFITVVELDIDHYLQATIQLTPSASTNVGEIDVLLNMSVTPTHYDRPIVNE